jgi:hypothetical protein
MATLTRIWIKQFFSPNADPRPKDGSKGEHLPEQLVNETIRTL